MDLRTIRKRKNLTQVEVAAMVGIKQGSYSDIERNRRTMKVKTAKRLAQVLGLDWHAFYADENEGGVTSAKGIRHASAAGEGARAAAGNTN